MSASNAQVIRGPRSALFQALGEAFNLHYPLRLGPDAVWLTILNGLTHHIDQNAEGLRHHFVEHEGKKLLEVEVQSPPLPYVPDRVWEAGIQMFSQALRGHIGKKHDLIVNNFTTTTDTDRLSSEITLMGAMKHYFEYKMMLLCGFTDVTVLGEPKDWQDIKDRLEVFREFDLGWWTDHLIPVVDQIKSACAGDPDLDFWQRAYVRHRKGSGSQCDVEGWINTFFPYLAGSKPDEMRRNPCLNWAKDSKGIDTDDFPSSLVSAPVLLVDHGTEYNFKFYGGLVGCTRDNETYTIEPVSGWAIQNLGLVTK